MVPQTRQVRPHGPTFIYIQKERKNSFKKKKEFHEPGPTETFCKANPSLWYPTLAGVRLGGRHMGPCVARYGVHSSYGVAETGCSRWGRTWRLVLE